MAADLALSLQFAKRGWRLLPVSQDKRPLIKDWPNVATTDLDQIRAWAKEYPTCWFGVCCGKEVNLLDVDSKNGQKGLESLAQMEKDFGPIITKRTQTINDGLHLYFDPEGRVLKNKSSFDKYPGIEFKAMNSCAVLPGSTNNNGAGYKIIDDSPIIPIPPWLLELLSEKKKPINRDMPIVKGERHTSLLKIAASMQAKGESIETIKQTILEKNATLPEPTEDKDLEEIFRWISELAPIYHLSDTGNAERMRDQYRDSIRYVANRTSRTVAQWYIYNGSFWEPDYRQRINQYAKDVVRSIYAEAAECSNDKTRKELGKFALSSEGRMRIKNMTTLLESELPALIEDFDTDPWLLNCQNGTLNLKIDSFEFREHRPADLMAREVAADYHDDAVCPLWETSLLAMMGGDIKMVLYLQRVLGYCLTGTTTEDVFIGFYGPRSRNGKSTILKTMHAILAGYSYWCNIKAFLDSKYFNAEESIAQMRNSRLVAGMEPQQGARFNEALIKQVSGGDEISSRKLYEGTVPYTPTYTIILGFNHRPSIRETGPAIWERLQIVPFDQKFVGDKDRPDEGIYKDDKYLKEKLLTEKNGILRWLVKGCVEWQNQGLNPPKKVREAIEEYREAEDVLGSFLDATVEKKEGGLVQSSTLHGLYIEWAQKGGIKYPWPAKEFAKLMSEAQYTKIRKTPGWFWRNLVLKDDDLGDY